MTCPQTAIRVYPPAPSSFYNSPTHESGPLSKLYISLSNSVQRDGYFMPQLFFIRNEEIGGPWNDDITSSQPSDCMIDSKNYETSTGAGRCSYEFTSHRLLPAPADILEI